MSRRQLWIIAAAGLVFALIFGVRQSVALFIGPINSATGLGIAAILVALVGWFWLRHRRRYGVPTALMLLQYAACRFVIEFFRGDEVRGMWFGGRVSTSQLVSVVLFALGLALLLRRRSAPLAVART